MLTCYCLYLPFPRVSNRNIATSVHKAQPYDYIQLGSLGLRLNTSVPTISVGTDILSNFISFLNCIGYSKMWLSWSPTWYTDDDDDHHHHLLLLFLGPTWYTDDDYDDDDGHHHHHNHHHLLLLFLGPTYPHWPPLWPSSIHSYP